MATMPLAYESLHSSVNGIVRSSAPATDDIKSQLWTITPDVAAELLRHALPNRRLIKSRVTELAQEMTAGHWATNGETIILDTELRLVDGQHRLAAVVESGCTIESLVAVGISAQTMGTIDQGRAKSAGDVLTMAGMEHAPQLASTARWLWKYENRAMRSSSVVLKNYELPAFVAHHGGLHTSLGWGRSLRNLLPPSCAGMLFYVTAGKDPALAKRFFDGLATGAELKPGDAAHVVRERLLKSKEPLKHAVVVARAAVTLLAWNTLRQGRSCSPTLSWRGVTDPEAAFPVAV